MIDDHFCLTLDGIFLKFSAEPIFTSYKGTLGLIWKSHMAAGSDDFDDLHGQVALFNTFAIMGACLILVALAPALFSSRVPRSGVWFCVLTSWLVYSVSFLLLIGKQTGSEPPFGLCFLQAALIYAAPPL